MCLGIPGVIAEMTNEPPGFATVEMAGVRRAVDTSLLNDVRPGDWVLVHLGFALTKMDAEEARAVLGLIGAQSLAEDGEPSAAQP
jgi:hydrogenase expression/formation protein HypC